MSIIIFIIILAILILVHELGHFIVAKKNKVRVDEFGMGYPPKLFRLFRWRGTDFTVNAIPAGGFVKIFGEDLNEETISGADKERSLANKPKKVQVAVLVAGVTFNILFAWLLISLGFMTGLPTPANYEGAGEVTNAEVVVTDVVSGSPAELAGLMPGDRITFLAAGKNRLNNITTETVSDFIAKAEISDLTLGYRRGEVTHELKIEPTSDILPDRRAIGISMDMIGILKLSPPLALWEGARTTLSLTKAVTIGLGTFLVQAVVGQSDLSQVSGPVGIVSMVGDVTELGFVYLLSFTAFISINLAVINLIPFPALDGGRILFIIIEAIKGSRIRPVVANTLNTVGFVLLLILMAVVTWNDVIKLF